MSLSSVEEKLPPSLTNQEKGKPLTFNWLLAELAKIAKEFPDSESRSKQFLKAVERFVRQRTKAVPAIPWLRDRLNPPPLGMDPCYITQLPEAFFKTLPRADQFGAVETRDSIATAALVPYAPPLEYLKKPPKNLYDPSGNDDDPLQGLVFEILMEEGLDQLYELAAQDSAYAKILRQYAQKPDLLTRIYATWAKDTAVDGADYWRSFVTSRHLTEVCHSCSYTPPLNLQSVTDVPRKAIPFGSPADLATTRENARHEIEQLLTEVAANIDNQGIVKNYKERVEKTFTTLRSVIDLCRWHLEHYTEHQDSLRLTLIEAYSDLNRVLQTCNEKFDHVRFGYFHDLSDLIAGFKVDQRADGRYRGRDTVRSRHQVDYFDTFMAVSHHHQTTKNYLHYVLTGTNPRWNAHAGSRSLFGDFESGLDSLRQQLITMAILYFRMPTWQVETYQTIIHEQFFSKIQELKDQPLQAEPEEPLLYVPSALKDVGTSGPFDLSHQTGLTEAHYLDPLYEWTIWHEDDPAKAKNLQKDTGNLEVSIENPFYGQEGEEAKQLFGLGTKNEDWWADELGFVHPNAEPKRGVLDHVGADVNDLARIKKETKEQTSLIEKITRLPSLLIEGRLGPELAQKLKEMLGINPKIGRIRTVAEFAATLERLLGRQPTADENSFIAMLTALNLINTESLNLNELDTRQLRETLDKVRNGKADLADLDEGSLILLLIATSGAIPRELLVELVVKSYESTATILTLEAIMALEKLNENRLTRILGLKPKKRNLILDARTELREFLAKKRSGPESETYNQNEDPEWRTLADSIIEKITKLIKKNKSYDITMSSTLIAVLTAKEDQTLVARCAVDGELLTAILQFVSPELKTYFAETYGPEENLTLKDWYQTLATAAESGHSSHAFNQTQWPNGEGGTDITVADATSPYWDTHKLEADQISWPEKPNGAMEQGEITQQNWPSWQPPLRRVISACTTGQGSHLLATLALEIGEVDYAMLANPDDPRVLLHIATDKGLPDKRRLVSLDRLLLIQPHILAMAIKLDFNRGYTAQNLEAVFNLAIRNQRWKAAFFACNILRHANYFTPEIRTQGNEFHRLVTRQFVLANAEHLEQDLKSILQPYQDFLVTEDKIAIEKERQVLLEQLAQEKEAREKLLKEQMAQTKTKIEAASQHLIEISFQVIAYDDVQKKHRFEKEPPLGYEAYRHKMVEIQGHSQEIAENTTAGARSMPVLDDNIFEKINQKTRQETLKAVMQLPQLADLTEEERLRLIQQVIWKIVLELQIEHESQLEAGAQSNSALSPLAMAAATETATTLLAGLNDNAKALGWTVPAFKPLQGDQLLPLITN